MLINALVVFILSINVLYAAVPGSSEPTAPPYIIHDYLTVRNDNWPIGGLDDNRTASADVGIQLYDTWRLGMSYDMFTQKVHNDDPTVGKREDNLSITLNRRMWDMLTFGAGVRFTGDLRGEEVQNWWHRTIGFPMIYKLDYPEHNVYPLVVADLRNYVLNENGCNYYWSGSWATCNRSVEQEYSVGIWGGGNDDNTHFEDGVGWIGLNYINYGGHTQGYVVDKSWNYEEGLGCEVGFVVDNFMFRMVVRGSNRLQGEFGIVF